MGTSEVCSWEMVAWSAADNSFLNIYIYISFLVYQRERKKKYEIQIYISSFLVYQPEREKKYEIQIYIYHHSLYISGREKKKYEIQIQKAWFVLTRTNVFKHENTIFCHTMLYLWAANFLRLSRKIKKSWKIRAVGEWNISLINLVLRTNLHFYFFKIHFV